MISFDPTVVTKAMMAPSIEKSCQSSLPLVSSTPIRYINKVFCELSRPQVKKIENEAVFVPENDSPIRLIHIAATAALHDLPDTDVGFFYSGQPVQST